MCLSSASLGLLNFFVRCCFSDLTPQTPHPIPHDRTWTPRSGKENLGKIANGWNLSGKDKCACTGAMRWYRMLCYAMPCYAMLCNRRGSSMGCMWRVVNSGRAFSSFLVESVIPKFDDVQQKVCFCVLRVWMRVGIGVDWCWLDERVGWWIGRKSQGSKLRRGALEESARYLRELTICNRWFLCLGSGVFKTVGMQDWLGVRCEERKIDSGWLVLLKGAEKDMMPRYLRDLNERRKSSFS